MSKKLLIDALHAEETRVALIDEKQRLIEYDIDTLHKQTVKGNIYLAKVMRVEPSLQAAFVEYGGNRHGFLAFSEIHPDYFRIPVSDREALTAKLEDAALEEEEEDLDAAVALDADEEGVATIAGEGIDHLDEDEDDHETAKRRRPALHKMYKIQEVIHKNQIVLIQVNKEERGQKGAALTTFLSLAGRYCVLMPNSPQAGGISRKISNASERKKMRECLDSLKLPKEMGMIIRTAGRGHTKTEIKRDATYLMRQWSEIREQTLQSIAPSLIYQEDSIIKRVIRDQYDKDTTEILIEGDECYKSAKTFMKKLLPSHAKNVKQYKDDKVPIFIHYKVEQQIEKMHEPTVMLPSGGSIVINPTEALVSIDINSGRATKERHIEETALNTNLEAAVEIARQVRMRDLAGLIVIDFIDMDDRRYTQQVERKVREAFKHDRARVQMGKISPFGLLELSRQRLRPSMLETSSNPCPHCHATGYVRSTESMALFVLRSIEEEGISKRSLKIKAVVPTDVAFYILNEKRLHLALVEQRHEISIQIFGDDSYISPQFKMIQLERRVQEGDIANQNEDTQKDNGDNQNQQRSSRSHPQKAKQADKEEKLDDKQEKSSKKPNDRNRRRRKPSSNTPSNDDQTREKTASSKEGSVDSDQESEGKERSNQRRRRHSNRRRRDNRKDSDPKQTDGKSIETSRDASDVKKELKDSNAPTKKEVSNTNPDKTDKKEAAPKAPKPKKDAIKDPGPDKQDASGVKATESDSPKKTTRKRRSWLKKLLD